VLLIWLQLLSENRPPRFKRGGRLFHLPEKALSNGMSARLILIPKQTI